MFWMGALTGAANKIQENYAEREARLKEQMDEARAFAKVNEKRKGQATEAYGEISRLAKTWGVDPSVVYDSWKSGYTPQLVKLVDELELKGERKLSPEEITNYISLGTDFSEETDVASALDKMYGVVSEYGSKENTSSSLGVFNAFARILGGDQDGAIQEMLDRRTVGGVNANALLNMGDPEGYTGTGSLRYDRVGADMADVKRRSEGGPSPAEATALAEAAARPLFASTNLGAKEVTSDLVIDHLYAVIKQDGWTEPADVISRMDDYVRFNPETGKLQLREISKSPMEERGWYEYATNNLGPAVFLPPEEQMEEGPSTPGTEVTDEPTTTTESTEEPNVQRVATFEGLGDEGETVTGRLVKVVDGTAYYKAYSANGQDELDWAIEVPVDQVSEPAPEVDPEMEELGKNISPITRNLLDGNQPVSAIEEVLQRWMQKREEASRLGQTDEMTRIDKVVKAYQAALEIRRKLENNGG